jgi:hypothetical protein
MKCKICNKELIYHLEKDSYQCNNSSCSDWGILIKNNSSKDTIILPENVSIIRKIHKVKEIKEKPKKVYSKTQLKKKGYISGINYENRKQNQLKKINKIYQKRDIPKCDSCGLQLELKEFKFTFGWICANKECRKYLRFIEVELYKDHKCLPRG